MAGIFLIGLPFILGSVSAPLLQLYMRSALIPKEVRLAVELSSMVIGGLWVYLHPPGGAENCRNWRQFIYGMSLCFAGGLSMVGGFGYTLYRDS